MSTIQKITTGVSTVLSDSFTSKVGEYDPARLFGYLPILLASFAFIGLSIYDTVVNKKFDYAGFAMGIAGVGAALAGAAAGVRIKEGSENQPPQQQ